MKQHSFSIYDASAGSGKTYSLVKEYLRIILRATKNDAYRNILAITFTNKAVHEMKSRIVGSLKEFAKDQPSQKALDLMKDLIDGKRNENNIEEWDEEPIGLSELQIKVKSQQIIKHIIHNYAAFDISTIDKFTHTVIRAFAHDLGLPITFEVSLDTENLLTEAVDALIAQAGEDEILTKLLVDFTMEKTDDDKSWDVSQDIMETGKLILNENNQNEIQQLQDKTIPDFLVIKNILASDCEVLVATNANLAQEALLLIDKNGIDRKSFAYETFPKHLDFFVTNDVRQKSHKFEKEEDIKIKKNVKDLALIEQITPELLSSLALIYSNAEKLNFYKASLKNITPLSLLHTVNHELDKIQKEQNILSISEFNAIIHREIQNQPAPFIYERLGERYQHFFIDEFQDTSEMQWSNLFPLIDNATSSEINGQKGTLMIVGDPKQSIYRWRGGKAEQFIALSNNQSPFNNPEKKQFHLNKNYRSYSEVIDFNNNFFAMLAHEFENEDYKDLYENHSFQKSNSKTGGYVNITFVEDNQDQNEEDEVLEKDENYLIATLSIINSVLNQGFDYKDIAILTRKRSHGVAVANYLTLHKIPLLSSETLMINKASEVQFIIHVLKYLKSSNNLEAKSRILYFLANHRSISLPVHDFMAQGMAQKDENLFENWLTQFDVALSFQDLRKKSLYESVSLIITKFLAHTNTDEGAYIQYFLDIVLERDVRNQAGINDFLTFWDTNGQNFSIPSPEGKNAVRIMTIHKSKGLEFPVVILPFAEKDYNRNPRSKMWLTTDAEEFGIPKVLVDNTKAIEGFGEEAKKTYDQKAQENLLDNINVLYVALTRAEEQLYIVSKNQKEKKDGALPNNMASYFIKYLKTTPNYNKDTLTYAFGTPKRVSAKTEEIHLGKNIEKVHEVLNPKNIKIAQKEVLMWGSHQQDAINYGNAIHEILSFVKNKSDITNALQKGIESGLINQNQFEKVQETIFKIVNHPELTSFYPEKGQVLNEQTIILKESNTIKPDRIVFENGNEVKILDYKTGSHSNQYYQQLQNYQNAIEQMKYSVTEKIIVYIGDEINIVKV